MLNGQVQQVTLPEIARFSRLLEKAVRIDQKTREASLRNLLSVKVQWSLKEIDSLQSKIQQLIEEEAIVEFITHEKKIEH